MSIYALLSPLAVLTLAPILPGQGNPTAASGSVVPPPAARALAHDFGPGVATAAVQQSASVTNLIVNGDFETYSGGTCDSNMLNAVFTAQMANATGFGTSEELDVYTNPPCFGLPAQSGQRKVSLHRKPDGSPDALSLDLSAPVVAGNSYKVSFWTFSDSEFFSGLGRVEVGLSSSPTSFGTLVFSGTSTTLDLWENFTGTFVAPVNATFLTVRSEWDTIDCWSHVDNFCLAPDVATYCTAKTGLVCGAPSISTSGTPAAGAPSGFDITSAPARGNRAGLVLYGCSGPAGIPFDGGWLCVAPPIRRLPAVSSGGTTGACDGVFTVDFNAFASGNGGGNPDPCLGLSGQQVNAQWWGRDSIATGSYLSDAVEFSM